MMMMIRRLKAKSIKEWSVKNKDLRKLSLAVSVVIFLPSNIHYTLTQPLEVGESDKFDIIRVNVSKNSIELIGWLII